MLIYKATLALSIVEFMMARPYMPKPSLWCAALLQSLAPVFYGTAPAKARPRFKSKVPSYNSLLLHDLCHIPCICITEGVSCCAHGLGQRVALYLQDRDELF